MKATYRLALANLAYPASPEASVKDAVAAIARAGDGGADVIAFPECFVPGYRARDRDVPPPDAAFLERAWDAVGDAARGARVAVVLGTERVADRALLISALVVGQDGARLGLPGQDAASIPRRRARTPPPTPAGASSTPAA